MSEAQNQVVRFLQSLAKAASALTLYDRTHPAAERAIWTAFEDMTDLQKLVPRVVLTFLGEEVVFRDRPIKALRGWEWGMRLAEVGVQRLEVHGPVSLSDFDAFVDSLHGRLTDPEGQHGPPDESSPIRFGVVGLRDLDSRLADLSEEAVGYTLSEEIAAMKWLDEECRGGGKLHMLEADTIVRSLAVAMHGDAELMIPLVHLKGYDQYTTTHSLNISVLAMALGEFLGLSGKDVRRLGVAGLLHDIGKTRVPRELLNKSGKLTDEEFAAIQSHPVEGARILIEREANLDLAATVAYEHHIRFDGGGYPQRRFKRRCHPASDLVHLCDVYDALRTHRPYRKAWGQERVLDYMEEQLGTEFDPKLGQAFLEMMRRWGSRLYRITSQEDAVGIGEPDRIQAEEPEEPPATMAAEVATEEAAAVQEGHPAATAEPAEAESEELVSDPEPAEYEAAVAEMPESDVSAETWAAEDEDEAGSEAEPTAEPDEYDEALDESVHAEAAVAEMPESDVSAETWVADHEDEAGSEGEPAAEPDEYHEALDEPVRAEAAVAEMPESDVSAETWAAEDEDEAESAYKPDEYDEALEEPVHAQSVGAEMLESDVSAETWAAEDEDEAGSEGEPAAEPDEYHEALDEPLHAQSVGEEILESDVSAETWAAGDEDAAESAAEPAGEPDEYDEALEEPVHAQSVGAEMPESDVSAETWAAEDEDEAGSEGEPAAEPDEYDEVLEEPVHAESVGAEMLESDVSAETWAAEDEDEAEPTAEPDEYDEALDESVHAEAVDDTHMEWDLEDDGVEGGLFVFDETFAAALAADGPADGAGDDTPSEPDPQPDLAAEADSGPDDYPVVPVKWLAPDPADHVSAPSAEAPSPAEPDTLAAPKPVSSWRDAPSSQPAEVLDGPLAVLATVVTAEEAALVAHRRNSDGRRPSPDGSPTESDDASDPPE